MRIGGAGHAPPPSQTGQADFPQSGFPVRGARWAGSGTRRRAFGGNAPAAQAARLRSPVPRRPTGPRPSSPRRLSVAPTRTASRHYVGPDGMGPARRRPPRSYVPWLHGRYPLLRYDGRSDPDRPFGRRRPWFPDSPLRDFRPCCLQPPAVLRQPRSTPSALSALFRSGFALALASSPAPPAESSSRCGGSTATALRPGRSPPDALHPGVWPGSGPDAVSFGYWPYSVGQVRDSHPAVKERSQAHERGDLSPLLPPGRLVGQAVPRPTAGNIFRRLPV
jgi:hypothetical protein